MARRKRVSITRGGCERCTATWQGDNAHMLAGKHASDTGHPTWSQTTGSPTRRYGGAAGEQPRMI